MPGKRQRWPLLHFTCSGQARTEHFQQRAEFPLLRNRGLGPLAVTVLSSSGKAAA